MTTSTIFENFINITTTTITKTNNSDNITTQPIDDNDELKKTLAYAIPVSCVTIVLVILIAIGIRHRHCLMEKWSSFKQMRNTNPKFYLTTGLRRDSEFDSFDQEDNIQLATNHQENNQKYRLSTIS